MLKIGFNKYLFFLLSTGLTIFAFFGNSCKYESKEDAKNSIISKKEANSYISKGQLNELIDASDTLIIYFNLSGCVSRRYDLVSIFRYQDTLYINTEIKTTLDEEKTLFGDTKKYHRLNDTLNFENLLIKIHKIPSKIVDTDNDNVLISIGVSKKWRCNYSIDRDNLYFIEIKNYYMNILNKIYPEIDEYKAIKVLKFTEDEIE